MGEGFPLCSLDLMAWEGRQPLRDWIYLSVSAFSDMAFHHFFYNRRSVTPIGLNFGHDLYPEISFLAPSEGLKPPYGVATRAQSAPDPLGRAPYLVAPLGIVSR